MARSLVKRIAVKNEKGQYEAPDSLGDVPDWVQLAYEAGWLAMTSEDDYTGVWVAIPGEDYFGVQVAMRAVGNDILMDHGEWIGVLKETEWEVWA